MNNTTRAYQGEAVDPHLKGLPHVIDLKKFDNRTRPNRGTRLVFEFFGGSDDFIMRKV